MSLRSSTVSERREYRIWLCTTTKTDGNSNGGSGTISILTKSGKVKSYRAGNVIRGKRKGIQDEDSLVYIAGRSKLPQKSVLEPLLQSKMHTKYEIVNATNNDCSMSNYVVLKKGGRYYNIEAEHGDEKAQRMMVDRLMKIINFRK